MHTIVHQVLSAEECAELITACEAARFTWFETPTRKVATAALTSPRLLDMLTARLTLPPHYDSMRLDSVSCNFRALKYVPGDYHGRHKDGTYTDKEHVALSGMSLLLYLNDTHEGGRTRFYDSDAADSAFVAVQPAAGMVCLFPQTVNHDAEALRAGVKYVIRTDVLYCQNYCQN